MNNLYKKLNRESDHIRLTVAERAAMRARIFGAPVASPVQLSPSPYLFISQRWMTAFASVVIALFAGTSTAFAAQGALPGQPLYAVKTQILEPVQVALATTPVAKAAVHVAIAQTRVEEAETLAQQGQLSATTSTQLADSFDANAQSADMLADQVAHNDPAAAVQIKTQLSASSAAGGAVLVALAASSSADQRTHVESFATRLLARAGHGSPTDNNQNQNGDSVSTTATLAVAPQSSQPKASATVRTFAAVTATSATGTATTSGEGSGGSARAEVASISPLQEGTAAQLESKAQVALSAAHAQYLLASSTLTATTTVEVESSLSGIESLLSQGSSALGDTLFDTAAKDFTEALGRSLKLEALLKAQQKFDSTSMPLLNFDSTHDRGDSSSDGN